MLSPEYNLAPVAGSCLGYTHTDEARANMSAAQKGSTASPKTRARQSKALKGKRKGYKHTAEAKAKMSAALKGRKNGPCSEETKAKISAANKGKRRTDAQRANISSAQMGKKLSEEHKAKLRITSTGRKQTKEARAKMSVKSRANRRLTPAQIHEIRHLLALGDMLQKEIAEYYPVNRTMINRINTGQHYADW